MTPKDKPFNAPAGRAAGSTEPTGVVGIGASAGGLRALEQFFGAVPAGSGMAFVVIQHLDPEKKSALPELLQRVSKIPLLEAGDGQRLEPDHAYIAPPGFEVSVFKGTLYLLRIAALPALHLPIDVFLRALAVDQQGRAAAVILSGMGSDGTLGARSLKEKAGAVFVQAPETAEFDAMPRSVLNAELADVVAAPAELPARLIAYFARAATVSESLELANLSLNAAVDKVLLLVRGQTGHDFADYKKGTVYRRIQRRMAIHQLATVDDYVRYVRENAMEAELLYKEMLIGVTSFFRDPDVWDELKSQLVLRMKEHRPQGGTLRAWVAACSTGEEAYTLAMVFREALEQLPNPVAFTLQIFATDLEKDAIARARSGVYPQGIAADVSPVRLQRFFTETPDGYRVNKEVRATIVFAQQSIASDPPFARLDVLTCRNLLIYLEADLQKKLLPLFHHGLNPGGLLLLGSAETAGHAADLFVTVNAKSRIYRRLDTPGRSGSAVFPLNGSPALAPASAYLPQGAPASGPSLQGLADQVLARRYAPSAVLVTADGDIVYFSGKTGKYLEPAAGKANLNLFAMARVGLSHPLAEVFYRAIRLKARGKIDEVSVSVDGKVHTFSVSVEPLEEPEALRGLLMVVFSDTAPPVPGVRGPSEPGDGGLAARAVYLGEELARSREENQSTREEMQIAQENLLSANEELQSANEELTTSREEMQSINEELQTVNAELQARVDALARASDDMENLLNSTDIATLFLDQHLNVRRFTTRATGLIKLIPGDVGRPITDIVSEMDYAGLASDAREVLRTLVFQEREVSATENRWFMVRTMPYRTQDNRIDGVVITFTDISDAKALEASLRKKA